MKRIVFLILNILSLVGSIPCQADSLSIKLSSGDEIPIERHRGDGDTLILWTPSNFGMQPTANTLAQELSFENFEVWLADLHTGFFVSRGSDSVNQFPADSIAELIDKSLQRSGKKRVLLLTTGTGARPILKAARQWQLDHVGNDALAGLLLFHPSLYAGRPELGETARYLPIVRETNLPIFIFQPTLSTTNYRVEELQRLLQSGGSQVYLRIIEGARDGYHVRPDDHLSEVDRRARAELSTLVRNAAQLVLKTETPKMPARKVAGSKGPKKSAGLGLLPSRIQPTPTLELLDLDGKPHRLQDYRGKVVLVSFWASWCPPCIKELPSMNRLQQQLGRDKFRILGVNIAERKEDVRAFLEQNRMDFTVLMDPDRQAYDAWKVYVVPSNFVIDGRGKVRLGSVGAIDWDAPEVTRQLRGLIQETAN